jgi:hypothetical protein
MGFLQGDTNNIIIDAVLTDTGRQFLARNDGSFSTIKFAFGDDEVDYGIIQKYGRTVGKEKIEKNTPIFEALTNGGLAQKYRCISISNPNLVRLPYLSLTSGGTTTGATTVSLSSNGTSATRFKQLTIEQEIATDPTITSELVDQSFIVEMNNLFLFVQNNAPDSIDSQRKATYLLTRSSSNSALGGVLTFTINTQAITSTQYNIYGLPNNKNLINTYVKVTGIQSGAVLEFLVQISQT